MNRIRSPNLLFEGVSSRGIFVVGDQPSLVLRQVGPLDDPVLVALGSVHLLDLGTGPLADLVVTIPFFESLDVRERLALHPHGPLAAGFSVYGRASSDAGAVLLGGGNFDAVPEPSSLALAALGLGTRRRR